MKPLLKYQLHLLRITFSDFKWGMDLILATVIAAFTTGMQFYWHLIPANQGRAYWISILFPYVVVFGLHIMWKRFTASWVLNQNQQNEICSLNAELKDSREHIENKKTEIENLNWPLNRPVIQFVSWDDNPEPNHFNQSGVFLVNTGGACLEVRIEDFKVGNQCWGGEKVPGITPNETKFLLVWNGQGNPFNKFDLIRSMREASPNIDAMYRPDFSIPVSALFRDSKNL